MWQRQDAGDDDEFVGLVTSTEEAQRHHENFELDVESNHDEYSAEQQAASTADATPKWWKWWCPTTQGALISVTISFWFFFSFLLAMFDESDGQDIPMLYYWVAAAMAMYAFFVSFVFFIFDNQEQQSRVHDRSLSIWLIKNAFLFTALVGPILIAIWGVWGGMAFLIFLFLTVLLLKCLQLCGVNKLLQGKNQQMPAATTDDNTTDSTDDNTTRRKVKDLFRSLFIAGFFAEISREEYGLWAAIWVGLYVLFFCLVLSIMAYQEQSACQLCACLLTGVFGAPLIIIGYLGGVWEAMLYLSALLATVLLLYLLLHLLVCCCKCSRLFQIPSWEERKQRAVTILCPSFWAFPLLPRKLILEHCKYDGQAYTYASFWYKSDKEIVSAAVSNYGLALEFASQELQDDKEIVLAACSRDGFALKYASQDLQNDKEVVLAGLSSHSGTIQFASQQLQDDKEVVLAACSQNGLALQVASQRMREDKEVVLAACSQDGWALRYASETLRANKEVVMTAIRVESTSIKFAFRGLNQDRDCLIAAKLWDEDHGGDTNAATINKKIVLSTKFSLAAESSAHATRFTVDLKKHPYIAKGNFHVYSPNAYNKGTCDPHWTNLDWPCRGTYLSCQKPPEQKMGLPQEGLCCWRYSFRYQLLEAHRLGGFYDPGSRRWRYREIIIGRSRFSLQISHSGRWPSN